MYELKDLEKWIRQTIVAAVSHQRVCNGMRQARDVTKAGQHSIVFKLAPGGPGDVNGQGVTRLMSRPQYHLLVCTKGAPTTQSEADIEIVDNTFNTQVTADAGQFRVSSRRLEPISYESPGATAEEFYVYRGGLYQFWVAGFSNH